MLAAVRRSLSFLTRRQRTIYFGLVILRALTAVLDVIGVALVGLLAAFAATSVGASEGAPASVLGIQLPPLTDQNLAFLVILVLVVFVVKAALAVALTRTLAFFIARIEVANAQKIVEHLLGGSLEGVKQYSKAEFQWSVTGSAAAAFTGVLNNVATIFSEGFLLLAITTAFLFVNPVAAIATIVYFGVIVVLIQFFIGRRLRMAGNDANAGTIETNNVLSDTLDSFREVFVLRRQGFFVRKVKDARGKLARSGATYAFLSGMPRYLIETGLILGVVAFVGVQLLAGSVDQGLVTVGVFLTGGVRIMASLLPLQTAVAAIRITSEQSILAHGLLASASQPGAVSADESIAIPNVDPDQPAVPLAIDKVSFSYATAKSAALTDVSLHVDPGAYVALIGPSGAGKTTLVDLILGLVEPKKGTVRIAGERPEVLRDGMPGVISYVPQKPGMISGSIADNIALGIPPEDVDPVILNRVVDEAYLREFIDSLPDGLDTSVGPQVDSLSGGQIQRIGLARALYAQPRLLILDEATSGLDAGSEAFIVKTLRALHGSVTVLVIAHRLSAVQHADNVYVMEKGRIVAEGDFATVRATVPMVEEYVQLMSFKDRQALVKTLVAIPAYNEELSLGSVLAQLKDHHPLEHVVVIDDGSADSTARVARDGGVRVIRHAVNLGVGAAIGTAFKFAAANGYDRMIQFDADGQHRPEHLDELLSHLSDDVDIVVGSRFAGGGRYKTTATRRAVMRVIAGVVSLYTRTKLTDVTSGFRVSGAQAIELFAIHYPVEYLGDTVESLVFASRQGLRIKEVPVLMNERLAGLPSQSIARASLYTGRILLILVLALFRSAPPTVTKNRRKK